MSGKTNPWLILNDEVKTIHENILDFPAPRFSKTKKALMFIVACYDVFALGCAGYVVGSWLNIF